jgi:holo-[acyl-carrier protein] synthase
MIVGIGIDLVDIARVQRMVDARGERALAKLFTEGETAYAMARAEPARHLAARVAAKEAAFKALSGSEEARGIGWREMEVVVEWDGRPTLRLHGAAHVRASVLGVSSMWITLSHSVQTAGAVVVLERE